MSRKETQLAAGISDKPTDVGDSSVEKPLPSKGETIKKEQIHSDVKASYSYNLRSREPKSPRQSVMDVKPAAPASTEPIFSSCIKCDKSQFTLGNVSGCTVMALEASLRLLSGADRNVTLIESILEIGAAYPSEYHSNLEDVLPSVRRYNTRLDPSDTLQTSTGSMKVLLADMYKRVQKAKTSMSALLTKPPESVMIHMDYLENAALPVLFDSHKRPETGPGAAILTFDNNIQLLFYLEKLFPFMSMPDVPRLVEEQYNTIEYTFLSLKPAVDLRTIGDGLEEAREDFQRIATLKKHENTKMKEKNNAWEKEKKRAPQEDTASTWSTLANTSSLSLAAPAAFPTPSPTPALASSYLFPSSSSLSASFVFPSNAHTSLSASDLAAENSSLKGQVQDLKDQLRAAGKRSELLVQEREQLKFEVESANANCRRLREQLGDMQGAKLAVEARLEEESSRVLKITTEMHEFKQKHLKTSSLSASTTMFSPPRDLFSPPHSPPSRQTASIQTVPCRPWDDDWADDSQSRPAMLATNPNNPLPPPADFSPSSGPVHRPTPTLSTVAEGKSSIASLPKTRAEPLDEKRMSRTLPTSQPLMSNSASTSVSSVPGIQPLPISKHVADTSPPSSLVSTPQAATTKISTAKTAKITKITTARITTAKIASTVNTQSAGSNKSSAFAEHAAVNELDKLRRQVDEAQRQLDADHAMALRLAEDHRTFECPICRDRKSMEEVFTVSMCDHQLCRNCCSAFIESQLGDGRIPVPCCVCRAQGSKDVCHFTDTDLNLIFTDKQRELYYRLSIDTFQSAHRDLVKRCPKPNCNGMLELADLTQVHLKCPMQKCGYEWCCKCEADWHRGSTCEKFQEWKKANASSDGLMLGFLDQHGYKKCPWCGQGVEKSVDCAHMKCKCGKFFCYRCGQKCDSSYDHFNKESPQCSLFDREELED